MTDTIMTNDSAMPKDTAEAYKALLESIDTDSPLAPSQAETLLKAYPYFSLAASRALLSEDLDEEQRSRFLACVALNAPDTDTLVTLIDPDGARFMNFYPDKQKATPDTDKAIDTFLDTYGNGIDPREEALLERLIFNPTPDYSEVLAREAAEQTDTDPAPDAPVSEQDALLDAFLSSQSATQPSSTEEQAEQPTAPVEPEPPRQEHHAKPDPGSPLSESLAKIFIKRGRYDKAYEIIRQLSLNFPEKSVYFADQLRFLRKLIINQQYAPAKNK